MTAAGGAGAGGGAGAAGTQAALRFMARVREDPGLREAVARCGSEAGLDPVLELAARAGFVIAADDLRAAFVLDWGLRQARQARG